MELNCNRHEFDQAVPNRTGSACGNGVFPSQRLFITFTVPKKTLCCCCCWASVCLHTDCPCKQQDSTPTRLTTSNNKKLIHRIAWWSWSCFVPRSFGLWTAPAADPSANSAAASPQALLWHT